MAETMQIGQEFNSFAEFSAAREKHEIVKFVNLVVSDSRLLKRTRTGITKNCG